MDHNQTYNPDDQIPQHVRAAQQAAIERGRRDAAAREERYKKNRAAEEREAKRQSQLEAQRRAELQAEREQMAQEQMENDKAQLRKQFEAAGGTESEWKGFWERNRDRLLLERMEANQAQTAHPSSYARGDWHNETTFTSRRV